MSEQKYRNYVLANQQSVLNNEDRREVLKESIRVKIFQPLCTCRDLKCAKGDYSNICFSFRGLVKLLNEKNIPSHRGKIGSWQTTQVSRLFPRSTINSDLKPKLEYDENNNWVSKIIYNNNNEPSKKLKRDIKYY